MISPIRTLVLAAIVLALPASAHPSSAFAPSAAGERTCWARSYTDAHLESHPGQAVKEMLVRLARTPSFPDQVSALVRARFRDEPFRLYVGGGACTSAGSAMECWIDGDGGRFRLETRSAMRIVLLNNDAGGLALETGWGRPGDARAIRRLTDHPQHRIFLLHRLDVAGCPDDWLR